MTAAASERILGTCQRDRHRGPEAPDSDAERSPPMSQLITSRARLGGLAMDADRVYALPKTRSSGTGRRRVMTSILSVVLVLLTCFSGVTAQQEGMRGVDDYNVDP